MRRRPTGVEGRRKPRERPAAIGKRVIKALLTLPGFEPAGSQAARNSRTGETIAPVESADEPSSEHGAVIVTAADGSTDQMPAHHYLLDQLARVRESETRARAEKIGAARDDGRQAVKEVDDSRKDVEPRLEGGDPDSPKRAPE